MQTIQELTDIEREVLRLIYFAPDHTADLTYVADRCYYPEQEVQDTLRNLRTTGYLRRDFVDNGRTYTPSADALEQMQQLNQKANANLQAGVGQAMAMRVDLYQPLNLDGLLQLGGKTYNLNEWLTFADYAQKYNLRQSTITMRILRGNIAPDLVLDLPRWGIKLVKDVPPAPVEMGRKPKAQ